MRLSNICGCAVLVCWCVVNLTHASVVHPDVMGDKAWYRSIEEGSATGDPLPLYGQPFANGDTLHFPTTGNFASSSLDGGPSDDTDGKLTLIIEAKPGVSLESFSIAEDGLVALDAPFGGDAFASILAFASVRVLEIDNQPVNLAAVNVFFSVAPLSGQYLLSQIGGTDFDTGWSANLNFSLPVATTKVLLVVNNDLFVATVGAGSRSLVDKKAFSISLETVGEVVPEPASAASGAASLMMLLLHRRRPRSSAPNPC